MNIYVQWATNPSSGWAKVKSKDWKNLPKKNEPDKNRSPITSAPLSDGGEVIGFNNDNEIVDEQPGWVNSVVIQGVRLIGDHIAIEDDGQCVIAYVWDDDPGDWSEDDFFAQIWKFYPIEDKGGETNTKQFLEVFANGDNAQRYKNVETTGGKVKIYPYNEFENRKPSQDKIRHGVWQEQELFNVSMNIDIPGWREWINDPL